MPIAFVTGGTGFLGFNLVKLLRERGWNVVAIHRGSKVEPLRALGVDLRQADLTDAAALRAAMPDAVDGVFHVAGSTNLWRGKNAMQTRTNVDGTRNVVRAALEKGARRLVHTSSVAAYGDVCYRGVLTEQVPSNAEGHWVNYLRTKWLAEQEVRAGVAAGLDAVLVNPANILGPHDHESWARMFRLVKQQKLPGVPPGSGTWVHVADVARAHLAALEKGRRGESYLLGGPEASYAGVIAIFARLAAAKVPRTIPAFMLKSLGRVNDLVSAITRKEPDVTPEIAFMLCSSMKIDDAKARRELGHSTPAIEAQIESTFTWMKAEGLA
jgi:nucleoside-diphosphate-sugar epimerase